MTRPHPIVVQNRSDATDIRRLITALAPGTTHHAPSAPTGQSPVIVELLQDIAGDDPRQYDAALMRIDGDQWVDTMQNVRIRNVTRHQLRQGERRIARPVAGLGLCVQGRLPASVGYSSGVLPPDWVTLKAFDANGAFLYEYKIVESWETHDGLIYATELREATGLPWTTYTEAVVDYGFGTNSSAQPAKTGVDPGSATRTWAIDLIRIDRLTGAKTLLHSNADYLVAVYDPLSGANELERAGIPQTASEEPAPQYYLATEAGLMLAYPLKHDLNGVSIHFYDDWRQSTTSRFRINPAAMKPITGETCQWTFHNGGSSATFAWNATAATIVTALESITGVVSATATGGPLPYHHVDVTVEWTTTTGRFTQIDLENSEALGNAIYDMAGGGIAGRIKLDNDTEPDQWVWTSDDAGIVSGNCARYDLISDTYGYLFDATAVWSGTKLAGTGWTCGGSASQSVVAVKHGKVLVGGTRRISGTGRTFAVIDEATGVVEGEGDTFLDGPFPVHLFFDADTVAAWGLSDCSHASGDRMTGGSQSTTVATTGGAATAAWMTGSDPIRGCDGVHVVTAGSVLASRATPLAATLLDRDVHSPHAITLITGGDAFFPTKDYNQHIVSFYAQNILYNTDLEWRLNLGDSSGSPTFQTSWFAYGETTANVMSELDAFFGNNSAGLPVIQENFATPADNAITPVPWYARGPQLLITASATPTDIPIHGLMPNQFRFQIELRNGTQRLQRSLCKISHADSVLIWQRDIGQPALGFSTYSPRLTYDHGVIVHQAWTPIAANTHPALVTGPLP